MVDIIFIVKGEKIRAHSVMISLASPISGALLKQAKDSEGNTWEIEDIDPGVFRHLFGTCTLEIVLNWMLQR